MLFDLLPYYGPLAEQLYPDPVDRARREFRTTSPVSVKVDEKLWETWLDTLIELGYTIYGLGENGMIRMSLPARVLIVSSPISDG